MLSGLKATSAWRLHRLEAPVWFSARAAFQNHRLYVPRQLTLQTSAKEAARGVNSSFWRLTTHLSLRGAQGFSGLLLALIAVILAFWLISVGLTFFEAALLVGSVSSAGFFFAFVTYLILSGKLRAPYAVSLFSVVLAVYQSHARRQQRRGRGSIQPQRLVAPHTLPFDRGLVAFNFRTSAKVSLCTFNRSRDTWFRALPTVTPAPLVYRQHACVLVEGASLQAVSTKHATLKLRALSWANHTRVLQYTWLRHLDNVQGVPSIWRTSTTPQSGVAICLGGVGLPTAVGVNNPCMLAKPALHTEGGSFRPSLAYTRRRPSFDLIQAQSLLAWIPPVR